MTAQGGTRLLGPAGRPPSAVSRRTYPEGECVPPGPGSGVCGSRSEFLWGLYLCIFLVPGLASCRALVCVCGGGDNQSPNSH